MITTMHPDQPAAPHPAAPLPASARPADDSLPPLPGQRLARGVARLLVSLDFMPMEEVSLASGLRADLMALGPKGEIWIVECKSCRSDFRSDRKWTGYLDWCDRYFWAVDGDFPQALLPPDSGLILADPWGAEVMRMPVETPLPAARRKAVTRSFARMAALRLQALRDPVRG